MHYTIVSKQLTRTQLVRFLQSELHAQPANEPGARGKTEQWTVNGRRFLLRPQRDGQVDLYYRVEPFEPGLMEEFLRLLTYPDHAAADPLADRPSPSKRIH